MPALHPGEPVFVPITPPTDAEVAALGRTAAYLDRAASEVGTRLLAALRESLLNGAALCADLLDLAAHGGER